MTRNVSKEENLSGEVARLRQLVMTLGRTGALRDPISSTCEHLQLTPSQAQTLMWLGHDGRLTMGELARRLSITEKTVTGVVDRLERAGLVLRERSVTDRRVIHCGLTSSGQRAYQRVDRTLRQHMYQFLELLDAEDRKALFRLMEKLASRLEDSSRAPGDSSRA